MRRIIPTLALVSISLGVLALAPSGAAAQGRSQNSDEPFRWSGEIQKDRWVYVHNVNGVVRFEATSGNKVEITATKHWRRGDPSDVTISVQQVGSGKGDVLVCALWRENASCDEDGVHSRRSNGWIWRDHNNDTQVEFVVKLPAGVRVNTTSVNGNVEINGATSEVIASTTNGSVEAHSTGGPVRVRTTNGNIDVRAGALGDERMEYRTTNGSITVELPSTANAEVEMRTTNGGLSSDFPLLVQGRIDRRHMQATLGKGGPRMLLETTNGSIHLRKA